MEAYNVHPTSMANYEPNSLNVVAKLKLNRLETKFFDRIVDAELDVPVNGTLVYQGESLEVIVVPKIAPESYFRFEYYNAPSHVPNPTLGPDGARRFRLSTKELLGMHPLLEDAWQKQAVVKMELKRSRPPTLHSSNTTLDVRVLYADTGNRGELVLDSGAATFSGSRLRKAEFSTSGFADFRTPEKQWASIDGIVSHPGRLLQSAADKLGDGARLNLSPVSHNITLDTDDGWRITLTKDADSEGNSVSHTGVVVQLDGSDFGVVQFNEVLEGLRYFFAFTMAEYCWPSVVIGYDAAGRVAYGESGEFGVPRRNPTNWFHHDGGGQLGINLEMFFPRFWRKWQCHKDELIAAIDAYVTSQVMRQAGVLRDAVAKSCGGLEIVAQLVLGQTIDQDNPASAAFDKVLRCYKIEHRQLDEATNPITKRLCSDLNIPNNGAGLLVDVRNYVTHPLQKKNPVVKPGHLRYVDGDPVNYFHLHDLSQFYLEHVLLRFCGFDVSRPRQLIESRRR